MAFITIHQNELELRPLRTVLPAWLRKRYRSNAVHFPQSCCWGTKHVAAKVTSADTDSGLTAPLCTARGGRACGDWCTRRGVWSQGYSSEPKLGACHLNSRLQGRYPCCICCAERHILSCEVSRQLPLVYSGEVNEYSRSELAQRVLVISP